MQTSRKPLMPTRFSRLFETPEWWLQISRGTDDQHSTLLQPWMLLTTTLLNWTEVSMNFWSKVVKKNKNRTKTTVSKLKHFMSIFLYVGIVRLPTLHDYWSTDHIFVTFVVGNIMLRHRFEPFPIFLHLGDNNTTDKTCPKHSDQAGGQSARGQVDFSPPLSQLSQPLPSRHILSTKYF